MKYRSVLEVDLHQIKKNCEILKNLAGDDFFCPMVKSDAYGHGIVRVSKALVEIGVKQVGVVTVEEAKTLREYLKSTDILIFGPVLNREDCAWIVENKIIVVCNNWLDLKYLSQFKKRNRIHLKFNTGFSRFGFSITEAGKVYNFLKDHPQIHLEGLATQLVFGNELGEDKSFSHTQLSRFDELKKIFSCELGHAFNSVAMISSFVNDRKYKVGVRPGISLFGIKPVVLCENEEAKKKWRELPLKPAATLKSYIVDLHQLEIGDSVSYGGIWKASRPSQIAVVSMGYADGFFRCFSGSRKVLFRGKLTAVVGTICMDFFMLDVTDSCKEGQAPVSLGEEVVIFGEQEQIVLSPETQATNCNTIPYELFSRLGHRVKRVYNT